MTRKQSSFEEQSKSLLYKPLYIAARLGLYPGSLPTAHIIFDLGGVLLNVSSYAMVRRVGLIKMLCCTLGLRCKPREFLFKVLNEVNLPNIQNCNVCDESGKIVPKAMMHWFCGTASCEDIQRAVLDLMEDSQKNYNAAEKKFIQSVVGSVFDPATLAHTVGINKDALSFVLDLIRQGHKVYVLSNWDAESFDYIRVRYAEIFELFDGVVISGKTGLAKPDPAIFCHVLDKYQILPDHTVFIDDQDENLKSAESLGLHAIKCPKMGRLFPETDFQSVRTAFELWQIERLLNLRQTKGELIF